MGKVILLIATHGHQPIGNFDFVLKEAYEKSYKPFIELLHDFPYVKMALHFSGYLLDWLVNYDKNVAIMLSKMVQRGQIELMGGGFYEPILSVIPDEDKNRQIALLSNYIKKLVHKIPKGFWLAERVWEPHLPKILAQNGMRYLLTDDSHFKSAGLKEEDLHGYYLTEEDGYTINIFPIDQKLRYLIPFHELDEVFNYLYSLKREKEDVAAILGDDTEKFGIWPGTYDLVYNKNWLGKFFNKIEENKDWLEIMTFEEYLSKYSSLGYVYLPTASYSEMMEWVMPADEQIELKNTMKIVSQYGMKGNERFVKGGYWRNFFVKYPESNNMHKKMLFISKEINKQYAHIKNKSNVLEKAYDFLLKSQVNCPYWHGVFGGLYLTNLRTAVHSNLINAQKFLDKSVHRNKKFREIFKRDVNLDGKDEIIYNDNNVFLLFAPHYGGSLYDFSLKDVGFNLMDTLSRKKEAYHKTLKEHANKKSENEKVQTIHEIVHSKEEGLENLLFYDKYLKYSFLDYALDNDTTIEDMKNVSYNELGKFAGYSYDVNILRKKSRISFYRQNELNNGGMLAIKKVFDSNNNKYVMNYLLKNISIEEISFLFGVELNINLLTGNSNDRYILVNDGKYLLGEDITEENANEFYLIDEWLGIKIKYSINNINSGLWFFPIFTISQSEAGFEKVYQGSSIFINSHVKLFPGQKLEFSITQEIERIVNDS